MTTRAFTLLIIVAVAMAIYAQDRTQAELRFAPATNVEKDAGVWVDGHYVGCVKELKGSRRVHLMPGKHDVVIREPWYRDQIEEVFLKPGTVHSITVSLQKTGPAPRAPANAAELKIAVVPARAAVFVDGQFVGRSEDFDDIGQALLVPPGQHKLTVALPGYLPFETDITLAPHQKLRIGTALRQGSMNDSGALVTPE